MHKTLAKLNDLELETVYRHKRTNEMFSLFDVRTNSHDPDASTVVLTPIGAPTRSFSVPIGVFENLYLEVEPEQSAGVLAIGSVALDYDGPRCTADNADGGAVDDPDDELRFKKPGRPRIERNEFNSYFGTARKHGPRRK